MSINTYRYTESKAHKMITLQPHVTMSMSTGLIRSLKKIKKKTQEN